MANSTLNAQFSAIFATKEAAADYAFEQMTLGHGVTTETVDGLYGVSYIVAVMK